MQDTSQPSTPSDTRPPRLSVLMPVYNAMAYLDEAVQSILNQTWRDFELILMDDDSTDGSWDALLAYAQADSRVVARKFNHTGHADLMNEGLKLAKADLIAVMHSDDIALPDRFEKQIAYMDTHPDIQVLGTAYRILAGSQPTQCIMTNPTTPAGVDATLKQGCCVGHPTVMFRKAAVLQAGGYHKHLVPAEDYDLWMRLTSHRPGIVANLPDCLLMYRIHARQASTAGMMKTIVITEAIKHNHNKAAHAQQPPVNVNEPITYERVAQAIGPDTLNRRIIQGYCLRLAQFRQWGIQEADTRQAREDLLAFAAEHHLKAYARARLALAYACAPENSTSPITRFSRWLQAAGRACLSLEFQKDVLRKLTGRP